MKRALQIGGIEYATKNIESVVLHFLYLTSVERLFQYFFSLSFIYRSELPLSMEQWHTIHVSRTARLAVLKVSVFCDIILNVYWIDSVFVQNQHNTTLAIISLWISFVMFLKTTLYHNQTHSYFQFENHNYMNREEFLSQLYANSLNISLDELIRMKSISKWIHFEFSGVVAIFQLFQSPL